MLNLPHASGFWELRVYQVARRLAQDVFRMTVPFPRDEMYSLTGQIRRSSRSIGANIAEAWAKRRYEKHFLSKLTDADGEQQETQHWIEMALDCGYWTVDEGSMLRERCQEIGRMLGGMMAKSGLFCGEYRTMREATTEYFVETVASEQ